MVEISNNDGQYNIDYKGYIIEYDFFKLEQFSVNGLKFSSLWSAACYIDKIIDNKEV